VGAHVRCFLLESVLVCKQSAEESNFHIFYQLVRGEL
jgi:myosin heavy subunit